MSFVIGGFFLFRIISTLVQENGANVEIVPVQTQSLTSSKPEVVDTKKDTKPVEKIQIPAPKTTSLQPAVKAPSKSSLSSDFYTVQVASFQDRNRAESLVGKLKENDFAPVYIRTRGKWFEICVGNFETPKEAKEVLLKLREDFFDAFTRKMQTPFEEM